MISQQWFVEWLGVVKQTGNLAFGEWLLTKFKDAICMASLGINALIQCGLATPYGDS